MKLSKRCRRVPLLAIAVLLSSLVFVSNGMTGNSDKIGACSSDEVREYKFEHGVGLRLPVSYVSENNAVEKIAEEEGVEFANISFGKNSYMPPSCEIVEDEQVRKAIISPDPYGGVFLAYRMTIDSEEAERIHLPELPESFRTHRIHNGDGTVKVMAKDFGRNYFFYCSEDLTQSGERRFENCEVVFARTDGLSVRYTIDFSETTMIESINADVSRFLDRFIVQTDKVLCDPDTTYDFTFENGVSMSIPEGYMYAPYEHYKPKKRDATDLIIAGTGADFYPACGDYRHPEIRTISLHYTNPKTGGSSLDLRALKGYSLVEKKTLPTHLEKFTVHKRNRVTAESRDYLLQPNDYSDVHLRCSRSKQSLEDFNFFGCLVSIQIPDGIRVSYQINSADTIDAEILKSSTSKVKSLVGSFVMSNEPQ